MALALLLVCSYLVLHTLVSLGCATRNRISPDFKKSEPAKSKGWETEEQWSGGGSARPEEGGRTGRLNSTRRED